MPSGQWQRMGRARGGGGGASLGSSAEEAGLSKLSLQAGVEPSWLWCPERSVRGKEYESNFLLIFRY